MIPANASPIQTQAAVAEGTISKPWPDTIRGIGTEAIDWDTYQLLEMCKGYQTIDNRGLMFEGETIIITGASSGIGAKMAVLFAELGATVINVDRDSAPFIPADGPGKILTYQHSFGEDGVATMQLFKRIGEEHGATKLFLNAGIFPEQQRPDPLGDYTEEMVRAYEKTVDINGTAAGHAYHSLSKYLRSSANQKKDVFIGITGTKNLSEGSHGTYSEAMALRAQIERVVTTDNEKLWGKAKKSDTLDQFVNVRCVVISPDANFDTMAYGRTPEEREAKIRGTAEAAGLSVSGFVAASNPAGADFTSWTTAKQFLLEAMPFAIGRNNNPNLRVDGGRTGS